MNCNIGVMVADFNAYNIAVQNSEFYGCRFGVRTEYWGQTYIRRCHFERSSIADFRLDVATGQAIRRCSSIGSRRFIESYPTAFMPFPVVIDGCAVHGWTDPLAAIWLRDFNMIFDTTFTGAPNAKPPVFVSYDAYKVYNLTVSNVLTEASKGVVAATNAKSLTFHELPANARICPVTPTTHFLLQAVPEPGVVFDAKTQFGAKADGKTDDTAATQKCINAARDAGKGAVAYFPSGQYKISSTINITGAEYSIEGTGYQTQFWPGESVSLMFSVQSPRNVRIYNFAVPNRSMSTTKITTIMKQVGAPEGSSVIYDRLILLSDDYGNDDYYKLDVTKFMRRGLMLESLSAKDSIQIGRLNGGFWMNNCGNADILANFADVAPMVIEGTETSRKGFFGMLNSNGANFIIKDNQNLVLADHYSEQVKFNNTYLEGRDGQPAGTVVIGGKRRHNWGTLGNTGKPDHTLDMLTIHNYGGFIGLAHAACEVEGGGKPTFTQAGSRTVDIVLLCNNYSKGGAINKGQGASFIDWPGGADLTPMVKNSSDAAKRASLVLDRFAMLGRKDLERNTKTYVDAAVVAPIYSVGDGTYATPQTVTLQCLTPGATIHYCLGGKTEQRYYAPLKIEKSCTLKAIVSKAGMPDSMVSTVNYVISSQVATPVFSPEPGSYGSDKWVRMSTNTDGTSLSCSVDGKRSEQTGGPDGVVTHITKTSTITAVATRKGFKDSAVATGVFTILTPADKPVCTPAGGTLAGTQSVTITSTAGATIRYTLDGATPTPTTGTVYNGPVNLSSTATLKAIAYKKGMAESVLAKESYNIRVADVKYEVPAGVYTAAQKVRLSTATPGATIRYTTDGCDPTNTTGTVFSMPIAVDKTTVIKAAGFKKGNVESVMQTGKSTMADGSCPYWEGFLTNDELAARDGKLEAALNKAGYSVLLFSGCATLPASPSWWASPVTLTKISGGNQGYDWGGLKWGGANRAPLCGEGDLRSGEMKITLTPKVTAKIMKRMAVILTVGDTGGSATVQLMSIRTGYDTTVLNESLTAGKGKAAVGKVMLLVQPSQPIEITLGYSKVPWCGISLGFEK